jgi:hypothetical protein
MIRKMHRPLRMKGDRSLKTHRRTFVLNHRIAPLRRTSRCKPVFADVADFVGHSAK